MSKLNQFRKELEALKKPKSEDPYDDRTTHCLLLFEYKGVQHKFDVRGWGKIKDNKLNLSVVNWTLCAGPARLTLDDTNVDFYIIKKEIYE